MISPELADAICRNAAPLSRTLKKACDLQSQLDPDLVAGVIAGDLNDVNTVRWGIIYGAAICDEVKREFQDLIEMRNGIRLCPVHGRSCSDYLASYRTALGPPVDPAKFPYYVLLVGSPTDPDLPWEFQERLSIQNAVGRLDFATDPLDPSSNNTDEAIRAFRRYIQAVIEAENRTDLPDVASLFSVIEEKDEATSMARKHLMDPLFASLLKRRAVSQEGVPPSDKETQLADWAQALHTRKAALHFSTSHGLERPYDSPEADYQGALVMRDGAPHRLPTALPFGGSSPGGIFTGPDPGVSLDGKGLIAFACHSAGCREYDEGARLLTGLKKRQSQGDRTSRLIQNTLGHEAGPPAFILAHVDRCYAFSFLTLDTLPYHQHFEKFILEVLKGSRAGPAFEASFTSWRQATLIGYFDNFPYKDKPQHWKRAAFVDSAIAKLDSWNYVICGDPAARLGIASATNSPQIAIR